MLLFDNCIHMFEEIELCSRYINKAFVAVSRGKKPVNSLNPSKIKIVYVCSNKYFFFLYKKYEFNL